LILAAVALAMSVAGQQPSSLYQQIVKAPDVSNGYEDYIRAADLTRGTKFTALLGWLPGQPERPIDAESTPQEVEYTQYANKIRTWSQLEVFRETSVRFGKALDIVRVGNGKNVRDPRVVLENITPFPERSHFKTLAKLHRADAYVKFSNGNPAAGTDSLLQGLIFSHKISGTTIISNLVSIACTAIVLRELDEHRERWSLKDCQRIRQTADAILAEPPGMAQSLKGERQFAASAFNDIFKDPTQFLGEGFDKEFNDKVVKPLQKMTSEEKRRLRAEYDAKLEEVYQAMEHRLTRPEKEWEASDEEIFPNARPDSVADALVSIVTPVFGQAFGAAARARTQVRLLGLHARILEFKWENGTLPATLEEAADAKLVEDPLTGGKFQYELRPGGYRLYSKGSKSTGEIELYYRRSLGGASGPRDPNEPPG
jgi:hypothetical protein